MARTLDWPLVATTNDLKNGLVLNIEGQLWNVVEFQHVKPGKGGAFVRTTLKNVLSGKVVDKTFNAGTKVEVANVDKREMQYLYQDGNDYIFMDVQTYDQIPVPSETVTPLADRLAQADPPVPEYSVELVEGVVSNRERIDELISSYSVGWTIDRMPAVDRNVLRLAIYELLWRDEVPDAVVIDEAV